MGGMNAPALTRRRLLIAAPAAGALAACQETAPPPSAIGGPFQLVDQNGRPVTEAILQGKWSIVFFGFTYCPDYCPTTLTALKGAETELGRRAKDVQTIFISVDPERDTPAMLKSYVENDGFPENIVALTGTPEQVAQAAKAFRAYYSKNGEGDDYLVDHLTLAYLMDPKGRFVRPIASGTPPAEIAKTVRDAMRQA